MMEAGMTHVIAVENVNQALPRALFYLQSYGIAEPSRNGDCIVAPGIVVTEYSKPWQRVLFSPLRDANPFFHVMETLWMFAGRNDIAFPKQFNQQMGKYSDDGVVQHGAYGHRWRKHFCRDQLMAMVQELKERPTSRRAVLGMWDSCVDWNLLASGKNASDLPCNTHAYIDVRGGKLNLTVCCRSNDLYWGAYGANVVHFSFLQEFLAAALDVPMGVYRQVSNNFHYYTEILSDEKVGLVISDSWAHQYTPELAVNHFELMPEWNSNRDIKFILEVEEFIKGPTNSLHWENLFLEYVAKPMYIAWMNWKHKDFSAALQACDSIKALDWRLVCTEWVRRRQISYQEKAVKL